MKPCEIERDAPLTPTEKVCTGVLTLWAILALVAAFTLFGGCAFLNEHTGSSTVIGEQMILPEITDSSDSIAVRVFEDIKGARIWTAKDSRVTIRYGNAYTNSYLGIVTTRDSMTLAVSIDPVVTNAGSAVSAPADAPTNSTCQAASSTPDQSVREVAYDFGSPRTSVGLLR